MTNSRAFTLIEVLIVTTVSAVLLAATTQLYVFMGRTVVFQHATIETVLGGSRIMDAARTYGLQANQIVSTHDISGTTFTTGTTTVVFELSSVDGTGAVIPATYDYIAIDTTGSDLFQYTDAAIGSARTSGAKKLADNLGSIQITYNDPQPSLATGLTVSATTSELIRGVTTQVHFAEDIYLRNI